MNRRTKSKQVTTKPAGRIVQGVDVDREYRIYGEIVPATTDCPRLRRTAYFYKREAISWARHARRGWLLTPKDCKELALRYLALFKAAKAAAGGAL